MAHQHQRHHHWGKAARYSSRDGQSPGGAMPISEAGALEEGEDVSYGAEDNNTNSMDVQEQAATANDNEEEEDEEEEEDDDTLVIRPLSTAVRLGGSANSGGTGDPSGAGHERHHRRRDKDRGSDKERGGSNRGESRDRRSSTAGQQQQQQQSRRGGGGEGHSSSSSRRHRDDKQASRQQQLQTAGKRSRHDREDGEESSDGSDRLAVRNVKTATTTKTGSGEHSSSPSVAPSGIANALGSTDSASGGPAQERAIRERLEKLAREREIRERQLQEELKKRGQDLFSPAQKAKMAQTKELKSQQNEAKKEAKAAAAASVEAAAAAAKKQEKAPEKLALPSRGISAFVEDLNISSPESADERVVEEKPPPKKQKTYEYSKFGDLDASSDESGGSHSPRRSAASRTTGDSPATSASETGGPPMTSMQRYLSERLDSGSRGGLSPAAIVKRAAEMAKNSPLSGSPLTSGQGGGGDVAPPGFASATFTDLFTDKPYEDSPKYIPPEIASLPPYFPALSGCRSVEEFECMNRIDEGTYGVVYRAKEKKTNQMVALKRLKMEKEREGFPITSLREIVTLLKAQHPNIVTVREIVVGSNMDKIYIVMDFVEHDLKALMESMTSPFLPGEVKTLMIQLLRGIAHMHDNWIIHRDLKSSNLLLSHRGVLKIGDFGLAREYGSPLKPYTQVVVTLWYRSPELLLGTKMYSTAVDMWSVGCIFAEIINKKPLFPGRTEMEQLNKIFQVLGTPNEKIWPGLASLPGWKKAAFADQPYNSLRNKFDAGLLSDKGFQLMNSFLTYNPERRISAQDALKHAYFSEHPLPVPPSMFPTWPAKSEGGQKPKKVKRVETPRAPEAGVGAYANLLGEDDDEERFKLNVAQGPSLFQIKP